MNEDEIKSRIIEKYFHKPNWRGIRKCIYKKNGISKFRIKMIKMCAGVLQKSELGPFGSMHWTEATWKEFNDFLSEIKQKQTATVQQNKVSDYQWEI